LRLKDKSFLLVSRRSEKLIHIDQSLRVGWRQGWQRCRESLDLKARLIHAADPARLLGMGFSLLRDQNGKLIRSLAQIPDDGVLVNQLVDGTVVSRVTGKKEKA
jgi:exonuclease VII large subunit